MARKRAQLDSILSEETLQENLVRTYHKKCYKGL